MKRLFAIALALIAMTACTEKRTNPFLTEWDTPFGIPPFEQIQNADYIPALQEGIRQHNAEIQAIIDNPEAPTFDNVIAAFDLSGGLLAKVSGVLFNLSETDNSPELEKVVEEATTLAAQHDNEITFNKDLFAKVEAINKQKEALGLTRLDRYTELRIDLTCLYGLERMRIYAHRQSQKSFLLHALLTRSLVEGRKFVHIVDDEAAYPAVQSVFYLTVGLVRPVEEQFFRREARGKSSEYLSR